MSKSKYINDKGRWQLAVTVEGRSYNLIKRNQAADAVWYVRVEKGGTEHWRSTDTADPSVAAAVGRKIIVEIRAGNRQFLEETKLRDPVRYASVAQVLDLYAREAPVAHKTVLGCQSSMRSMLRAVLGPEADPATVIVTELTGKFVRDFQGGAVERIRKQKLSAAAERAAIVIAQRSANSTWTQTRSLFVAPMLARYKDAGLNFPDCFVADFVKAPKIKSKDLKERYVQPGDELIMATLAAGRAMVAEVNEALRAGVQLMPPNPGRGHKRESGFVSLDMKDRMAVCFGLEIGCGLRKGEVLAARRGWIGPVNGQLKITVPGEYTKNHKARQLQIPPKFQAYLLSYLERRNLGADDRLLSNPEKVARAVSAWLRGLGWNGQKTNHALRKYAIFRVAKKHGFGVAQRFADHKDIATTQDHYAGLLEMGEDVVVDLPEE